MCDNINTAEVVADETKGLIAGSDGVTNLFQKQSIVVLSKFLADLTSSKKRARRGHGGDAKKFRDCALDELS